MAEIREILFRVEIDEVKRFVLAPDSEKARELAIQEWRQKAKEVAEGLVASSVASLYPVLIHPALEIATDDMPEDKSDEANVHADKHQGPPPPEQLDLPEVEVLQMKVEALEAAVESLTRKMTKMQLHYAFLKAIVGWEQGAEAPLSKDKLTDLREYAAKLGIKV